MRKSLIALLAIAVIGVMATSVLAKGPRIYPPRHRPCTHAWRYVAGHTTYTYQRILVRAGYYQSHWVEGTGQWTRQGNELVWVVSSPGHWRYTWVPPRYESRRVPVYHPGYWVCVYCGQHIPEGSWTNPPPPPSPRPPIYYPQPVPRKHYSDRWDVK